MDSLQKLNLYLSSSPFFQNKSFTSVNLLSGGLVNFVYRLTLTNGDTFILKNYPPYIASAGQSVPFSQQRYFVEKQALTIAASQGSKSHVRVPQLFYADDTEFILIMEDIGAATHSLFNLLKNDGSLKNTQVHTLVDSLWTFLSEIQDSWKSLPSEVVRLFRNEPAVEILNSYIIPLYSIQAKAYGLEKELEPYLQSVKPGKVPESDFVLTFGDLWPNSIYWNTSQDKIFLIDWEVCRFQKKNQDIKQLLCNLWVMKQNPEWFDTQVIDQVIHRFQSLWFGDAQTDWRLQDEASKNYFILFVLILLKEKHWGIQDPATVMRKALAFE